jgi:hypothetical protein
LGRRPERDIHGSWPFKFPHNWQAAKGWFVYLLRDSAGSICYVGQTGALRSRLQRHALTKSFASWYACGVADKRASLDLETVLFYALRPYLYSDGSRRTW